MSVFGWGALLEGAEDPDEIAYVVKSEITGYRRDALCWVLQHAHGKLNAACVDILNGSLFDCRAKEATKITFTHVCLGGEVLNAEFLMNVLFDICEHILQLGQFFIAVWLLAVLAVCHSARE